MLVQRMQICPKISRTNYLESHNNACAIGVIPARPGACVVSPSFADMPHAFKKSIERVITSEKFSKYCDLSTLTAATHPWYSMRDRHTV